MNNKIEFDKKTISTYKSIVKKMFICVSKFGTSKEKDDTVYLYHYIDKNNQIYPVLVLNQDKNPWGDIYYPANLFIVEENFPTDIDLFNTNSNEEYIITDSVELNISNFKKDVKDIKELYLETASKSRLLNIPGIISSTRDINKGYVDKFKNIPSLDKVIWYDKDKFNNVSDENTLRYIHTSLNEETHCSIHTGDKKKLLKIFFSIAPLKMDKFEYVRYIKVVDNDVTSTVYCKQTVNGVVIHNFYKYVDIWSFVNIKDK